MGGAKKFVPPVSQTPLAWQQQVASAVNQLPANEVVTFEGRADGTGDSYAALQEAIDQASATKRTLHIPGGDYKVSASLTIDENNFRIIGDGWLRTRIFTTAAVPALIINGRYGHLYGIGLDGSTAGTYGIVCKDAGLTIIEWCDARHFDNDGLLIDPTHGGGADGSNNLMKVVRSNFNQNAGCGVRMAYHGDNGGINFMGVETSANTSHGILIKSTGTYIDESCITEGNGGYGYQIGEAADGSLTIQTRIMGPWIESNALGGVRAERSESAHICFKNIDQTYSAGGSSSVDTIDYIESGLRRIGSNDGVTFVQFSGNTTSAFILAASRTGGNVHLNIGGAGTGIVKSTTALQATGEVNVNGASGTARFFKYQTGDADSGAYHALGGDNVTIFNHVPAGGAHTFEVGSSTIASINATGLLMSGTKVLGAQGAAVADATDAASVITQLNALLARCRAHGLIAT